MQIKHTKPEELLVVVYRMADPYLYGSIATVDPDTLAEARVQGQTFDLNNWGAPYIIAKHLGGKEIVYASIPYLIGEVAKPIFRLKHRLNTFEESLPSEIRQSMQPILSKGARVFTVPGSRFPEWFIHRQDELVREAVLVSALHFRTLLDIFNSKGKKEVPIYDYEGNPNGKIGLHRICSLLVHHRYGVVSDQFIHNLFSDEEELPPKRLFGSKVNYAELLNAMISQLSEITINDFVGVLRGRLLKLSADSPPRDIMFITQNVHVLSNIIGDRIVDPRFRTLQNFLFSKFTADENRQIEAANGQSVELVRRFNVPRFKVFELLRDSQLTMSLTINGKVETFQVDQMGLFDALTQAFGDDPIMTIDKLMDLYDKPELEVFA